MLLPKEELIELAEARENDEIHQSKLLNPKNLKYDYKVLMKKNNFTVKPGINFVVVSTNEDRNPIYRFRFSGSDLKHLFAIGSPKQSKGKGNDIINIFIKDGKPELYISGNEPYPIFNYLY